MIKPKAIPVKGDAKIPNKVDVDQVKDKIQGDHFVQMLVKEGAKLIARTNRPNIITLEQFMPYVDLYRVDKVRYSEDDNYRNHLKKLYEQYIRELEINLYEIIIVIKSKEEPEELVFLDRLFTRFKSDVPTNGDRSHRDSIPAAIARNATTTRDQEILKASLGDVIKANKTPEALSELALIKMESAIVSKNFVARNLSPEKRAELTGVGNTSDEAIEDSSGGDMIESLDDDD